MWGLIIRNQVEDELHDITYARSSMTLAHGDTKALSSDEDGVIVETEKDFQLNHEGHEVHEGRAGFTTQLPQGRRGRQLPEENTQGVDVLPSCLSTAKQPLPGRGAETGRTQQVGWRTSRQCLFSYTGKGAGAGLTTHFMFFMSFMVRVWFRSASLRLERA